MTERRSLESKIKIFGPFRRPWMVDWPSLSLLARNQGTLANHKKRDLRLSLKVGILARERKIPTENKGPKGGENLHSSWCSKL